MLKLFKRNPAHGQKQQQEDGFGQERSFVGGALDGNYTHDSAHPYRDAGHGSADAAQDGRRTFEAQYRSHSPNGQQSYEQQQQQPYGRETLSTKQLQQQQYARKHGSAADAYQQYEALPASAESARPFSPEQQNYGAGGGGLHARSGSYDAREPRAEAGVAPASTAPGAYESYSEQHDSVPTSAKLKPGKESKGSNVEKPKKGLFFQHVDTDGKITEKIAWLCGSPNSNVDWSYVLALADAISSSEAAAKEAARAVRKELKYGEPEAQRRATRVLAILMINASDRFRMQIATKRFLEVVDQTATSSKTDPSVSAKIFDVLAVLAFLYQDDADLGIITKCWNKIKPKDRPLNGEPLDPDSEDFNPPLQSYPQPRSTRGHHQHTPSNGHARQEQREAIGQALPRSELKERQPSSQSTLPKSKKKPRDYSHRIVSPDEDMRKLHEECQIGRANARVLIDTLASSGLQSPLIPEFAHKVELSQMFLVSQIDWASAQANRSRDFLNEQAAIAAAEGQPPPPMEETKEEALLANILSANERLMEAQQMIDDARRHQMEEEEEDAVRQRSRVETRLDRSMGALDINTRGSSSDRNGSNHPFGPSSSGSSGPGPGMGNLSQTSTNGAPILPNPFDTAAPQPPQHARGPLPKTPAFTPASAPAPPPPPTHAPSHAPPLAFASGPGGPEAPPRQGASTPTRLPKDDDEIQTPVVPSEKALGKRRAFSDRGDAFDPDVQAQALAAKSVHHPVRLNEVLEQDDTI